MPEIDKKILELEDLIKTCEFDIVFVKNKIVEARKQIKKLEKVKEQLADIMI